MDQQTIDDLTILYNAYRTQFRANLDPFKSKEKKLRLPSVPAEMLKKILYYSGDILLNEPNILKVSTPVYVIGDLHGHIMDILNIFSNIGEPSTVKYLFLGDFVDRGEFSPEIIIITLLMKILFPDNIFMIRGNHEFRSITRVNGFGTDIMQLYNSEEIFEMFMYVFSNMPLAAFVDDFVVCLHGGIGPHFTSIKQLNYIARPIEDFNDPILVDLLWSDPCYTYDEYLSSPRQIGSLYGQAATKRFLANCGARFIVRGHQMVEEGIQTAHGGRVITVFSASSYCGLHTNKCGVLYLSEDHRYEEIKFDPCPFLRRLDVNFSPLSLMKIMMSTTLPKPIPSPTTKKIIRRKKITVIKKKRTEPHTAQSYAPESSTAKKRIIRNRNNQCAQEY